MLEKLSTPVFARRTLIHLALALALLAGLAAPSLHAQAFVATYPDINPLQGGQAGAVDRYGDQFVLAGLRQISPLYSNLALDLVLRPTSGIAIRYSYTAAFLDLKYSDFEILTIIPSFNQYAVFLNKLSTPTDIWSGYVLFIDRNDPTLVTAFRVSNLGGGEGGFLRFRDVVALKGGYGVLGALEDGLIGASTFLAKMTSGGISWSNTYPMPQQVEYFSVTRDSSNLVAGGWIADLESDDIAETVLLQVSQNTGAPVRAKHYQDIWGNFDMPVETSAGQPNTTAAVHVAATTSGTDVLFFSVDSQLVPSLGSRVELGQYLSPREISLLPGDGALAILDDGSGSPHHVLRVPNFTSGPKTDTVLYDFDALPNLSSTNLTSLSQGASYSLVVGGTYDTLSWPPGYKVLAARTSASGAMDYCVPAVTTPAPVAQEIATVSLAFTQLPITLGFEPIEIYGWWIGLAEEEHICH